MLRRLAPVETTWAVPPGLGGLALWNQTKMPPSVPPAERTMTRQSHNPDHNASDTPSLETLVRELEGSTHGGPRHFQIFDSLKRVVASDPQRAIEAMRHTPASGRAPILTALTALGRRVWPALEFAMHSSWPIDRHNGSMILYGLAVRGMVSRQDDPQVRQWLDDEIGHRISARPDASDQSPGQGPAWRAPTNTASDIAAEISSDQISRVLQKTLELLAGRRRDAD